MYSVFFFQAEDGIRDGHVTGVQTCALPIYARLPSESRRKSSITWVSPSALYAESWSTTAWRVSAVRSEERRVGKSVDRGDRRMSKKKKLWNESSGHDDRLDLHQTDIHV